MREGRKWAVPSGQHREANNIWQEMSSSDACSGTHTHLHSLSTHNSTHNSRFQAENSECMVMSGFAGPAGELSRLNIVVSTSFSAIPEFMTKVLVMLFYANMFIEGAKVYVRARWSSRSSRAITQACLLDEPADVQIWFPYVFLFVAPVVLWTALTWILSGSFLFSLTCVVLLVLPHLLVVAAYAGFLNRLQAWTEGSDSKLGKFVYSVTWWAQEFDDRTIGTFGLSNFGTMFCLALGPVVAFGSILSTVAYGGVGFLDALYILHEYVFDVFTHLDSFTFPTLGFHLRDILAIPETVGPWLLGLVDDLTSMDLFKGARVGGARALPSAHARLAHHARGLEHATRSAHGLHVTNVVTNQPQALMALANSVLLVIKLMVTSLTSVLALGECTATKNATVQSQAFALLERRPFGQFGPDHRRGENPHRQPQGECDLSEGKTRMASRPKCVVAELGRFKKLTAGHADGSRRNTKTQLTVQANSPVSLYMSWLLHSICLFIFKLYLFLYFNLHKKERQYSTNVTGTRQVGKLPPPPS